MWLRERRVQGAAPGRSPTRTSHEWAGHSQGFAAVASPARWTRRPGSLSGGAPSLLPVLGSPCSCSMPSALPHCRAPLPGSGSSVCPVEHLEALVSTVGKVSLSALCPRPSFPPVAPLSIAAHRGLLGGSLRAKGALPAFLLVPLALHLSPQLAAEKEGTPPMPLTRKGSWGSSLTVTGELRALTPNFFSLFIPHSSLSSIIQWMKRCCFLCRPGMVWGRGVEW